MIFADIFDVWGESISVFAQQVLFSIVCEITKI
jgi:hypothetical protein